jgi:Holliday junction DNA helicase RuvA
LYGFPSRDDRAAFRALISVSGVGPKIAVALLGGLSAGELATVIARGEVARLVAVPGIGKKTAERLILELKGKLHAAPVVGAKSAAPVTPSPEGQAELLSSALTRMGFRPAEADRAVAALGARVKTEPLGDLIRDALALLSKK